MHTYIHTYIHTFLQTNLHTYVHTVHTDVNRDYSSCVQIQWLNTMHSLSIFCHSSTHAVCAHHTLMIAYICLYIQKTVVETTSRSSEYDFFDIQYRYPTPEIDPILRNQLRPPPPQTETQDQPSPHFLHLPYVRGISERIERVCR